MAWQQRDPLAALIGSSPAMRALRAELRRLARTDSTLLLRGETGTGKGLAARLVHEASPRRVAPFAHVDCAALAPSVIESELFGHERGAFTGADAPRVGRLEAAAAGTLFLDEIAELTPTLQAKLLRALQDRAFERVGGDRTLRLRARVVAATHRDLRAAVADGRFRADLYFRLQVFELEIPPLRERREDLPELAVRGIESVATRLGREAPALTACCTRALARHDWPGNVRELWNLLERLVVRDERGRLDGQDAWSALEPTLARAAASAGRVADAPDPETERIARALVASGGNVARTARRLGLARSTLRHRIARLGLEPLIPRD